MRRSAFGLALTLSVLLPATAFAGGLPSAFDPIVFTVVLCDFKPDPQLRLSRTALLWGLSGGQPDRVRPKGAIA